MAVDPPLYPVGLVLAGREVLVVGGGAVAAAKLDELVACGARPRVVAVEVGDAMRARLAAHGGIPVAERAFRPADVDGAWFVVAATGDPAVNEAVRRAADRSRVFVNAADDPDRCSASLPARLRRGALLVTVATQGRSPAVASWLRRRLEAEIGPEYGVLVDLVAEAREQLRAAGIATEGLDWQTALDAGTLEDIREGRLAQAKERLLACLSSSSD